MAGQNMGQSQRNTDLLQELCDQRRRIIESIRCIRMEPYKTIRQVEVSEATNSIANTFVKSAPNVNARDGSSLRYGVLYSLEPVGSVYELLARDAGEATVLQADQKFKDWEEAINHLRRYAFNLLLAPRRPEFQSIKLYSSFYVYQVSKKLNGAEMILMAMGYRVPGNRSSRDADELRIEGEVDLNLVANAAADLVILQHDLKLLKGNAKGISADYPEARISEILEARSVKEQVYRDTYDEAVARVRSRLMLSPQTSPTKGHLQSKRSYDYNGANSGHYGKQNGVEESGVEQSRREYNPVHYASSSQPKRPNTILPHPNRTLISRSPQIEPRSPGRVLTQHDSAPLLDVARRQPDVAKTDSNSGRLNYQMHKKCGSEGNLLDRVNSEGCGSPRQQLRKEGMWEDQHSNPSGTAGIKHVFGSPNNLEESFSVISNCGSSPPPNPEDLPEPVFASEAAVGNNQYERHLRYSCSERPPWLSPEISPYVEENPYKALQPLQPDPRLDSNFANCEGSVHCANGFECDSKSAHTSKPLDHRPGGNAGEGAATVKYTEVVCHGEASRPSRLGLHDHNDDTVVYSTVMRNGTSHPSNLSNDSKSSRHPDGCTNEKGLKRAPNHDKESWQNGDRERVSGQYGDRERQNGEREKVPGQKSPPQQTTSSSSYGHANAPPLPPRPSNASKSSIQSNENSNKDSSSMNKSTFQNGSQSNTIARAAQDMGEASSNLGQDLKAYRETEVDGFLSIDMMPKSSPTRPRASHISEPSKVDYEDKLKADKAKDNNPAKTGDLSSGSESNLDFKGRTLSWICDYCTFINTDADECEVCGILRKSN